MNPRKITLIGCLAMVMFAGPALAIDIYLNGVRITGVRNQEFENATVSLDAQGNVRIKAPQYRVRREDTKNSGPAGIERTTTSSKNTKSSSNSSSQSSSASSSNSDAPPQGGGAGLSRRYWLVGQVNSPGMVQYNIEIRINGRLVRRFSDSNVPPPVEVTQYLRPGRNSIRVIAEKINDGTRRSDSSRHWLRIVVSDGHIEGSSVVIDHPGVIFTRNAAQMDRVSREFFLTAQ